MNDLWLNNCPSRTCALDSLSVLFPAWEGLFADVVSAYMSDVSDQDLKLRMEKFIAQELAHKKAHHAHNKRIGMLEHENEELLKTKIAARRPKLKIWLAAMVSIEHIAANMSRRYLSKYGDVSTRGGTLFRWHSVEELEHKSLALDLWDYLGYSRKDLRKIAVKNLMYVMKTCVQRTFLRMRIMGVKPTPTTVIGFASLSVSVVRHIVLPHLKLLSADFHPGKTDDTKLIETYA